MIAKNYKNLLETLCKQGLASYFILHKVDSHIYFGMINYEKGHLVLKNTNILHGLKPELFEPVWHEGLVGMICASGNHEWESLSFYGLEHCKVKPDLGQTRGNALIAAQNQYGDSIMSFQGSIYRGFKLLLENSFLPVILLNPITSIEGEQGLVISDLRTVPMKIDLLIKLNEMVVKSIDNIQALQINDIDMSDNDFHKYFDDFISYDEK